MSRAASGLVLVLALLGACVTREGAQATRVAPRGTAAPVAVAAPGPAASAAPSASSEAAPPPVEGAAPSASSEALGAPPPPIALSAVLAPGSVVPDMPAAAAAVADAGAGAGSSVVAPGLPGYIDPWSWFKAKGATRRPDVPGDPLCTGEKVGPRHEPALDCDTHEVVSRGSLDRMTTRTQVFVVRAKRVVVVADAVTQIFILDSPRMSPHILDLAFLVAPDGLSARLDDMSPKCAKALPRLRAAAKHAPRVSYPRFDLDLVRRACAARGRFRWRHGRFVRTSR